MGRQRNKILILLTTLAIFLLTVGAGCDKCSKSEVTISLSHHSVTLAEGENFTLSAEVSGTQNTPVWSSSEPGVAAVGGDGTVFATGVGTANITATVDGVSDTCVCTVAGESSVLDFSYVNLHKGDEIELYVGETFTVLIENESDYEIIQLSVRDTTIADIDGNVITAVAEGNSYIDVSVVRGGTTLYDVLTVTVKEHSYIDLSESRIELEIGESAEISVTELYDGGKDVLIQKVGEVSFNTEDEAIAEFKDGKVTAKSAGETKLVASYTCASGLLLTAETEIMVIGGGSLLENGLKNPETNWTKYEYGGFYGGNTTAGLSGIKIQQNEERLNGYVNPELLSAAYESGYRYITLSYENGKGSTAGRPWVGIYIGSDADAGGLADKQVALGQEEQKSMTLPLTDLRGNDGIFRLHFTVAGGWASSDGSGYANFYATLTNLQFMTEQSYIEVLLTDVDTDYSSEQCLGVWQGNVRVAGGKVRVHEGINNNMQAPYPSASISPDLLEKAYEKGYRYITVSYENGTGNSGQLPWVAVYTKDGYQESSTSANRVWNTDAASGNIVLPISELVGSQGDYTLQIRVYGGWGGVYDKYFITLTDVGFMTEKDYFDGFLSGNANFASDGMTGFYTKVWDQGTSWTPEYKYDAAKGGIVMTNAQRIRFFSDFIAYAAEAGYTSVTCTIKAGGTTDPYWMFVRTYDTETDASKNLATVHGTETTESTVTVNLEDLYYKGTNFADYTNSYVLMFHLSNDGTSGIITNVTFNK